MNKINGSFRFYKQDLVWQRNGKSKESLKEPVIKILLKQDFLNDNDVLKSQIKQKEIQNIDSIALPSETQLSNIIKFIELHLPNHSNTSHFLKGQNKFNQTFSDELKQIFWNPCAAHHEVNTLLEMNIK